MLEGQQGVEISVGPQPKKDEMFGKSKEISFNVIMSNLEFSFTCREKKHSQIN